MKSLLLSLLLLTALLLAGCGEESGDVTVPNESVVYLQDTVLIVNASGDVVQIQETIYGTLHAVDTTGTTQHFREGGYYGLVMTWTSPARKLVSIIHRYKIDSTTYDTIRYERQECEVTE